MLGAVLVPRPDRHIQHQSNTANLEGVVGVRRTSRLVRVVAHNRALLMTVKRLDRGVAIHNPRPAQHRLDRLLEMTMQPGLARRRFDLAETATHRILTHYAAHPQ